MLSDIEIDVDGSLILGFSDRFGHQHGYQQLPPDPAITNQFSRANIVGGIERVCYIGGSYILEGATGCPTNFSGITAQGPNGGEFYDDDISLSTLPAYNGHEETAMGALALLPASGQVVSTNMDPVRFDSGGLRWYDNTDGAWEGFELYYTPPRPPGSTTGTFNKGAGLGDLELFCNAAPLEIGNYVWFDEDGDGIQDPCENGISGVTVRLTDSSGVFTDTVTDGQGEYYFAVQPNSNYTLTIDLAQSTVSTYTLTTANANSGTSLPDGVDSDGVESNGNAVITLTTGNAGENDHTFDFGFYEAVEKVALGNLVWIDDGAGGGTADNGIIDGTEAGLDGVTVELYQGTTATGTPLSTTVTSGGGFYLFDQLDAGDYVVHIPASQFVGGALLEGYQSSTGAGADDTNDDNVDENGLDALDNGGISSAVINLAPDAEPTSEAGQGSYPGTLDDDNVNMTVDFSFYQPAAPQVLIGDRVWIEDDNDGLATTGVITPVVGTVVTAVGSDGTTYTDTTDGMGYYTITVPANAVYTVTVGTPAGTVVAVPTGGLIATDNDPNADDDTSHDPAGTVVTVGTEDNLTIDFGFYELPPGTPSLAISKMLNTPEPVNLGQPISFTIRITNTGDVTITTLPLIDTYDTTYLTYDSVNGSIPATDNNANDGQLEWSDLTATEGDLAPGNVIEVVVNFTPIADTSAAAAQSPCVNAGESCNVAAVNNATAGPDPVPPAEDSDDITIEELITGKSTLGDFVWYDTNGDGIKDLGELGINGVIINLYDSTGLITTTVTMSDIGGIGDDTGATNGDGFYDFQVVESTVYTVEIDPSNFDPGGALEGYIYTGNNATLPYNGDETRVVIMPADQHDENNVDFSYVAVAPLFELSKVLNTPPPARVNDVVSFTIRITNTGTTVITTVPLLDSHNSAYLTYVTASPLPDVPVQGELRWHDLTAAGVSGFGMDLDPGATFEIVVEFLAMLDTTGLPNDSAINLADSQGITDTAEIPILAPTSVQLAIREVVYKDGNVTLQWETADETNVVGFHIYRQLAGDDNEELVKLTNELLIAKKSGSTLGAAYIYEDERAQAGVDYRYFVGILDTNGLENQELLGNVLTQRTFDERFTFLPLMMK